MVDKKNNPKNIKPDTSTQTAIKVFLLVVGIIGLLTAIPWLIAFIPTLIFGVVTIGSLAITSKGLLMAAAIVGAVAVLIAIILAIILSIALVWNFFKTIKIKKWMVISTIATLFVALIVYITACSLAGVWYSKAGKEGIRELNSAVYDQPIIKNLFNQFSDDFYYDYDVDREDYRFRGTEDNI